MKGGVLGALAGGIAPPRKPMTRVLCWARAKIGGRKDTPDHTRKLRRFTRSLQLSELVCKALPLLSLLASQYSFHPTGYILRRAAFSSMVSGKNSSSGDEKAFGRQGAGRPHIRVVGSLLWLNPIACAIARSTTLRATLGSVIGYRPRTLIPINAFWLLGQRAANDMNSPSESARMRSPGN